MERDAVQDEPARSPPRGSRTQPPSFGHAPQEPPHDDEPMLASIADAIVETIMSNDGPEDPAQGEEVHDPVEAGAVLSVSKNGAASELRGGSEAGMAESASASAELVHMPRGQVRVCGASRGVGWRLLLSRASRKRRGNVGM